MAFEDRVAAACSSSSLGKDSDEGPSPAGKEDGEEEVQSAYGGAGLAGLGALEEALPIRHGISQFYNGKSRSFTILKDAIGTSGSAKVIAKADNAYTRKRKILLAHSIMYDKSQTTEAETYENGIPKRIASLSRLRPVDSISPNSSCSSLSSDENELPQQSIFVQSPDHTSHFASPTMTAPWLAAGGDAQALPPANSGDKEVSRRQLRRHPRR
ncbi:hypothetical protein QYE76_005495 [Lolium multiflorum]|uniref:Uncharacterized protein n=1 Tax=Lolium multiflorum TaxID=4521 RepID=A0AAD8RTY2_LOLMU|nr:hypothetical protein QYE76_005495 [Lolium multiflorum]